MGDKNAPSEFNAVVRPWVAAWNLANTRGHRPALCNDTTFCGAGLGRCSFTQRLFDCSFTPFADDMFKRVAHRLPAKLPDLVADSVARWDRAFEPVFRNHRGKMRTLVSLQGVGAKKWGQMFFRGSYFPGVVCQHLRCLGGRIHFNQSLVAERTERLNAIRAGWRSVGAFWVSGAPFKIKRELFQAKVYSPALSGTIAFFTGPAETNAYDKIILAFGRVLLQTFAKWAKKCERDAATGDDHFTALTGEKVWKAIGLVPVALEVVVQRLRWLQDMTLHQDAHAQVIGAIFGKLFLETSATIDGEGRPTENSNPLALAFADAVAALASIEDALPLLEDLDGRLAPLFCDELLGEDFRAIDVTQLRRAFLTKRAFANQRGEQEAVHRCTLTTASGATCGLLFSSANALKAHMRNAAGGEHGTRALSYALVLSNQCPLCMSTFADRKTAQNHLIGSIRFKRCYCDNTTANHELVVPSFYSCPIISCGCFGLAFPCWEAFQRHVRVHLPEPDFVVLTSLPLSSQSYWIDVGSSARGSGRQRSVGRFDGSCSSRRFRSRGRGFSLGGRGRGRNTSSGKGRGPGKKKQKAREGGQQQPKQATKG